MKNRDFRLFFQDIMDCIDKIQKYTLGMTFEKFMQDEKTIDAVMRNFEVMGEAVKYIPEELTVRFNKIPYKVIAGMRNVLIHDYLGIDFERVWDTVQIDLPELKNQVEIVIKELNKENI